MIPLHHHLSAAALLCAAAATAGAEAWQPARSVRDIEVESRPTESGFRAFRGSTVVCTDLQTLHDFVTDPDRFDEWIPFTETARRLPSDAAVRLYYLRTRTPWPLRSRDMVYRLSEHPASRDDRIILDLEGAPEHLPPQKGAVRMQSARGQWRLWPRGDRVEVTFGLALDPGRIPAFFANRRLAATVGGMLANLAQRFPCADEADRPR